MAIDVEISSVSNESYKKIETLGNHLLFNAVVYYYYYYFYKLLSFKTPRHIQCHSTQLSLVTALSRSTIIKYKVVRLIVNTDFFVAGEHTVVTIVTTKLQTFDPD